MCVCSLRMVLRVIGGRGLNSFMLRKGGLLSWLSFLGFEVFCGSVRSGDSFVWVAITDPPGHLLHPYHAFSLFHLRPIKFIRANSLTSTENWIPCQVRNWTWLNSSVRFR